jgi:hypothetical protein
MVKETLGDDWLHARLVRFGASTLVNDVLMQIAKTVETIRARLFLATVKTNRRPYFWLHPLRFLYASFLPLASQLRKQLCFAVPIKTLIASCSSRQHHLRRPVALNSSMA